MANTPSELFITGGTVVSDGHVNENATVAIKNGLIESVGRFEAPADKPHLDAAGLFVIPGVINGHAHGLTTGPLFSSAAEALPRSQVLANADRHLAAGVTTALNLCGFTTVDDVPDHDLQILFATNDLPSARLAADIVDGTGLRGRVLESTAEALLNGPAIAIGEVGSGATLGGGVAAYRYVPAAVAEETGIMIDVRTAMDLIDALVGPLRTTPPNDAALRAAMERHGVESSAFSVIKDAVLSKAAAPVSMSLKSFAEAVALSESTGASAIFHSAGPSVDELLRLARGSSANIIAGHMNHPTIEATTTYARDLREAGAIIDVSSLDVVHACTMCDPDTADELALNNLVDTLSTDYAAGAWEPMLGLAQRWVDRGYATVAQVVDMCTARPADALGMSDRGRLAVGLKADVVLCEQGNLEAVRTVLIDGRIVVGNQT